MEFFTKEAKIKVRTSQHQVDEHNSLVPLLAHHHHPNNIFAELFQQKSANSFQEFAFTKMKWSTKEQFKTAYIQKLKKLFSMES
jgi:hypothetical protein